MVEYGNGISHGPAGQVGGTGAHPLAQSPDFFSSVGRFANDAYATLSTMPPIELLGVIVIGFIGLMILRRVFF